MCTPFSYTIFFLVDGGFLGGAEALVLLGRAAESTDSCGRGGPPLFERMPFSAELAVGGFRRGLEDTEEVPLLIGGNDSGALVLLLREVPTREADRESDLNPLLSGRRGLPALASDLWLTL